eukprot:365035-Chlamydomonas_euryale.AAC.5
MQTNTNSWVAGDKVWRCGAEGSGMKVKVWHGGRLENAGATQRQHNPPSLCGMWLGVGCTKCGV